MNQMELRLTIRRLASAQPGFAGAGRTFVPDCRGRAPHAMVMVDEQGQIIQANSRTEQLFGLLA
jgi:PAS domain-containing protein